MKTEDTTQLEAIKGIGSSRAAVLRGMGIRTLADLSQATVDEIVAGFEHAQSRIAPEMARGWIASSARVAADASEGATVSDKEPDWKQRGAFTIFFDRASLGDGTEVWKTRVYDNDEAGAEFTIEGHSPVDWVDWIVRRIGFDEDSEALRLAREMAEEAAQEPVEIVAVKAAKMSALELGITTEFVLSNALRQNLPEGGAHYQVDSIGVRRSGDNGSPAFVSTAQDRIDSSRRAYAITQQLPLPVEGRYEIHTRVQVVEAPDAAAEHAGPIVNVRW
jgi:hypothetical protein